MPPTKKKTAKKMDTTTTIRVKDDTRKKCHNCGEKIGYHFECGMRVCGYCGAVPKVKCAKCGKREGTTGWVGTSGILAWTHGMYERWCEICVLEAQLEYARERATKIPEMEKRLEELKKAT